MVHWGEGHVQMRDMGIGVMEDQARFRRHKGACPFYRENWVQSGDIDDPGERETVLYEIYCLKNTPPLTAGEQKRCMCSPRACWRPKARAHPPGQEAGASTTAANRR